MQNKDIRFIIQRYKEPKSVMDELVESIHSIYEGCNITVICDGTDPLGLEHVTEIAGEHLKTWEGGGRWTQRYLEHFLTTSQSLLIKVDPDTKVLRKIEDWPQLDNYIAGREKLYRVIHGGAVLYSRAAVQTIVDTGYFNDPWLANNWRVGLYQDHMMRLYLYQFQLTVPSELRTTPIDRKDFACHCPVTENSKFSHP